MLRCARVAARRLLGRFRRCGGSERRAGRWESEGRRVFLLGESRDKVPPPAGWRLVHRERLEASRMERKKGGLPTRRLDSVLDIPLYLHGVEKGGTS